ncbi:MAG: gluconokinase [Flavobacteriaceae bacterium]
MAEKKKTIFIVMGVSGSGKSTLGRALADHLQLEFIEGDNHHTKANIEKMSLGIPLTDTDRQPWLESLNAVLIEKNKGVVLACSALKKSYRHTLQKGLNPGPKWIFLEGKRTLLQQRMTARNHFMPVALLKSQFETLEKPENAFTISCALSTQEQLKAILNDSK